MILVVGLLIIRLPALSGPGAPILTLVPTGALLIGGHALLRRPRRLAVTRGAAWLYIGLLALIAIAYYQAGRAGLLYSSRRAEEEALGYLSLAAFAFNAIAAEPNTEIRKVRITAACFSVVAYVGVNILLHFGGVAAASDADLTDAAGPAQLLSLVGVSAQRVFFPYGDGLNGFGIIAGASFIVSLVAWLRMEGWLRRVGIVGTFASFYGICATDSRASLFFAVGTAFALFALPRAAQSGARGLPLLVPFSPAIITSALGFVADTGVSSVLSRGGSEGSFTSGTGRVDVWRVVLGFLGHFTPHELVGWGFGGQLTSGVSYSYAYLIETGGSPETATAHNFILESILDVGYIGLALWLVVFLVALRRGATAVGTSYTPAAAMVFGVLLFFLLSGMTESSPGDATPGAFGAFLVLVIGAFALDTTPIRRRSSRQPGLRRRG
jgi:hypothetical protein